MKIRSTVWCSLLLVSGMSAKDITVSPGESLSAARDAAHKGDCILLKGGTYRLDAPLLLGPQNSGITWTAVPGEKPVISGGVVVSGWTPDTNGRFKATVNLDNFRQLWVNGQRAKRARGVVPAGMAPWGKTEATVIQCDNPPGTTGTPGYFTNKLDKISPAGYTTTDVKLLDWKTPQDIECGYNVEWTHPICKIEKISKAGDGKVVIEMSQPGFFLSQRKGGVQVKLPAYIENALELLDEPGEWYFDRPAHMLYYMPRPGEDMSKVEVIAPKLETLVEVKGTLDNPVIDIRFEGLTFSHATWLRPSSKLGHPDVQGNFIEPPDNGYFRKIEDKGWVPVCGEHVKSPANIIVDAGHGISFESCVFTALGGAGLDLQNGAQGNSVNRCLFTDIAGSGIQIGGVSAEDHHPRDKRSIVKDNHISNSIITKIGQDYCGSIGIFYGYTDGTVISHNEISWVPYSGISGGWGWGLVEPGASNYESPVIYHTPSTCRNNIVEANNIHHIMLQRRDGGAIYMLGSQPGSVIRDNVVHDDGPGCFGGVYFDEGTAGIEVTGNAFYDINRHTYFFHNYLMSCRASCPVHDNTMVGTPGAKGRGIKGGSSFDLHIADTREFTITLWVRIYPYLVNQEMRRWLICRGSSPEADGSVTMFLDDKNVGGSINIGGGEQNTLVALATGNELGIDKWTQLALTCDGEVFRVFCGGKEIAKRALGKERKLTTAPLTIGGRGDLLSNFERGEMDEVAVFNRALAPEELANAGKDTKGIVHYLDFEDLSDKELAAKIISQSGPEKSEK